MEARTVSGALIGIAQRQKAAHDLVLDDYRTTIQAMRLPALVERCSSYRLRVERPLPERDPFGHPHQ